MKKRNSNVELLRILSMILIVTHHYALHGLSISTDYYASNKIFADILLLGGKLGVDIFVLITGYFMINSKFSIKKFIKLECQILFYSITILLVFILLSHFNVVENTVTVENILKSLMPTTYSLYWFATIYILLMIFSGAINKLLLSINKKEHLKIIVILIFIFSILTTILNAQTNYSELIWFITLYIIAAYIRLYVDVEKINIKKLIIIMTVLIFALVGSTIAFDVIGRLFEFEIFLKKSTYLASENSILVWPVAIILLIISLKKTYHNKAINTISSATFGVYLIHENVFMRPFIWNTIFKCKEMVNSKYIFVHAIIAIITVYCVCTLIELIRQNTVEKLLIKKMDEIEGSSKYTELKIKIGNKLKCNSIYKYFDE